MKRIILLTSISLLAIDGVLAAQPKAISLGDLAIKYDVTGSGHAVVFIHGWTHNLSVWDDQVPVFNKRYRVLRYDSPGFGRSTGFSDALSEPEYLRALLDSLGITKVYVIGHSRGGGVALRFARQYPDRVDALVLYGAGAPEISPFPPDFMNFFASLPALAQRYGLDSAGKAVFATELAWAPPGRRDVRARLEKLWASYAGRDLLDPHPPSNRAVPLSRLSDLHVPTLVLIGDHEIPFIAETADTLAHQIPNARKVVIRNAGHVIHFAEPALFNKAILGFFASVERNQQGMAK